MKAYILVYDNGESWEDHNTENIMVFMSKLKGEQALVKINKWVDAKKKARIDVDFSSDEEYNRTNALHEKFRNKLKPYMGIEQTLEAVLSNRGYFILSEIKLIK